MWLLLFLESTILVCLFVCCSFANGVFIHYLYFRIKQNVCEFLNEYGFSLLYFFFYGFSHMQKIMYKCYLCPFLTPFLYLLYFKTVYVVIPRHNGPFLYHNFHNIETGAVFITLSFAYGIPAWFPTYIRRWLHEFLRSRFPGVWKQTDHISKLDIIYYHLLRMIMTAESWRTYGTGWTLNRTFVISCLHSCARDSSENWYVLNRKNVLPTGAFFFSF